MDVSRGWWLGRRLDGGWDGGVRLDLEVVLKSTENSAWKLLDILAESAAIKAPDIAPDNSTGTYVSAEVDRKRAGEKKAPGGAFLLFADWHWPLTLPKPRC